MVVRIKSFIDDDGKYNDQAFVKDIFTSFISLCQSQGGLCVSTWIKSLTNQKQLLLWQTSTFPTVWSSVLGFWNSLLTLFRLSFICVNMVKIEIITQLLCGSGTLGMNDTNLQLKNIFSLGHAWYFWLKQFSWNMLL